MKLGIIPIVFVLALLGCQNKRTVPAVSHPCLIGSCATSYEKKTAQNDLGYHSLIAMVETMNTLDWDITSVDVQARTLHARSCPWDYCFSIAVKTYRNGEVTLYPAGQTRPKYRTLRNIDLIVERFSEISCFSASLIENRLTKEGYQFFVQ